MEIGETIKINDVIYLILDILEYNNTLYYFLNRLDNNDITELHEIYKVINNTFIKESNQDIINNLLPIINNDIKRVLTDVMEETYE